MLSQCHLPSPLDESVLRDLKALLIEAKQKVPPVLLQLDALSDDYLDVGGVCVCVCGEGGGGGDGANQGRRGVCTGRWFIGRKQLVPRAGGSVSEYTLATHFLALRV